MDVGPPHHHHHAYDLRWRLTSAPVHLCTLLRCIEVVDEFETGAAPLPPPERTDGCDRPLYAVSPIGRIEPSSHRAPPPDPVEQVRVLNWFHVTNLGTLLDVMA